MMGDDTNTTAKNKPPLSCTSCRTRKLKCDKQNPCRNCVRSGSECIFPARKRIQRPRKTKNAELLHRLHRLESIVGKVGLANLEEAGPAIAEGEQSVPGEEHQVHHTVAGSPGIQGTRDNPRGPSTGVSKEPMLQDSAASRYLSGQFWSSLCDEVGGLRQALEQSTDSDDEDDTEAATPESAGGGRMSSISTSPGMLLGTSQISSLQTVKHPAPDHIRYLASVYVQNVDMHLKILHRPTILSALSHLADHPETASDLSPEREALFFAIYYAAVTSLNPNKCVITLGVPRADLSASFQVYLERALVRADYLNNTGLETLQALTIYTCCLRAHNGSRASWALLGLPIRLAQALNIHQDGDGTNSRFSPYEAELRRRLWWQLIVLDIRSAEDRGTNTIIARGSYNTRLPHNIDDTEFGPDTTTPLRDRPGPSDTTFSLCTAQSSGIFLWFEHAQGAGPIQSEEDTVRQAQFLEEQFVKAADPGHIGSYLASVTVRLIILKMWLIMRYPLHRQDRKPGSSGRGKIPATLPPVSASDVVGSDLSGASSSDFQIQTPAAVSSESTLRTAISIMELQDFGQKGPYSDRFSWWSNMYVQWHPLAVALAELCTQTQGETVERAWQVVEDVFPRWSDMIADAKSGSLWRPIRKLYKKAKEAREAALSKGSGGVGGGRQKQSLSQSTQDIEPRVHDMAIYPGYTGQENSTSNPSIASNADVMVGGSHGIRSDDTMTSEARAHLFTSPMMSTQTNTSMNTNVNRTPAFSSFPNPNTITSTNSNANANMDPNMSSYSFPDFDPIAKSLPPSWFVWPEVSFDMPTVTHDTIASHQVPTPGGDANPTLLDNNSNRMDWSTWDEFVADSRLDPELRFGGE